MRRLPVVLYSFIKRIDLYNTQVIHNAPAAFTSQRNIKTMLRTAPLIVILGSTGTGKTKLSIELARRFAGEIISADSMQVYRGLNIATAKATADEQTAAPHHLLDVAQAGQPFTVVDFRDAALPVVEDLLANGKMPIVVGGTNYYIESLLWRVLVAPPPHLVGEKRRRSSSETAKLGELVSEPKRFLHAIDAEEVDSNSVQTELRTSLPVDIRRLSDAELDSMSSKALHDLLRTVDAPQAARLHPNNRRKSLRALQIYRDCGQPMSAVLAAQQQTAGGSCLGGPLRYEHTVLLWLRCDPTVLDSRLDARIDDMVAQGLLAELRGFYDGLGGAAAVQSYTKGILQTIGFKEFVPYLERFDRDEDARITAHMRQQVNADAGDDAAVVPDGLPLLRTCLEELRLVTKRYARKQIKWVSNRFVANSGRRVPPIYELDSSQPSDWQTAVFERAENIVTSYMEGVPATWAPMQRHENPRAGLDEGVSNVCETCNRTFVGEFQWRIHLRSNKHKRAAAARKVKQSIEVTVA